MAKEKMDAFVSIEEQPYSIPENWLWMRGWCWLEKMETRKPIGQQFKYIDIESIDNKRQVVSGIKYIDVSKAPSRASRAVHSGDTIFSTVRPYLKNIAYIDESLADAIASTGFYVCSPKQFVDPRYCYYLMTSTYTVDGLNAFMKGDNSPSIRNEDLENYAYPIPPLPEQQRIVDRIESLFSKLDEAKEKAQAVVDGYEDRKAAILHQAFTGELTAEWRKNQTIDVVEWKQATFDDIIISIKNGTTTKQNKEMNNYPVTRIESLQRGTIDFSRLGYIVDPTTLSEDDYYKENDIALSHINSAAHVGKTALIKASFLPLVHGMNLLRIRLNSLCIPEFFIWYSRSVEYKEQITHRINMAVNQVSINQKQLRTVPIPIPQTKEQEIIVRLLNDSINKLEQVRDTAEQIISQIDTMKKAILARAFRGELGTNDPSELPADISIS